METKHFLNELQNRKRSVIELGRQIMLSRMVADNITDIIPIGWKITPRDTWGLRLSPEENVVVTADQFDKIISKFARTFNKEPRVNINTDIMDGSFWVYPGGQHIGKDNFRWESIMIEIVVGNTEKCEFIYKRKMNKQAQLTGYCKILAEKKYLKVKNIS
jgi:hypothetical protein